MPHFPTDFTSVSDIWFDVLTVLGFAESISDDEIDTITTYTLAIASVLQKGWPRVASRQGRVAGATTKTPRKSVSRI